MVASAHGDDRRRRLLLGALRWDWVRGIRALPAVATRERQLELGGVAAIAGSSVVSPMYNFDDSSGA